MERYSVSGLSDTWQPWRASSSISAGVADTA